MSEITRHPLTWPIGRARAASRKASSFRTNFGKARDNMLYEVHHLGGRNVVLSSNLPLRADGLPYANGRTTNGDSGVAVYFDRSKKRFCFACDLYWDIASNVHAIGLTVQALRGIARWGTGDMLESAISGFAALPEKGSGKAWYDTLRCPHDADEAGVESAFKLLAKVAHPDIGGDIEHWHEIHAAYEQGLVVARGRK